MDSKVSQRARDAAATFYGAHLSRPGEVPVAAHMRAGKIDESPLIQAFARFEAETGAEAETYRQMHDTAVELGYPSILEALEDLDRIKARTPSPDAVREAVGWGEAELRVSIQRGLIAELGDVYDCTRVWEGWGVGTMDQDDFVPVLDRVDEIITTIIAEIKSGSAPLDHLSALQLANTRMEASDKPWPLAGYAPGHYMNKCIRCDQQFEGDKRALHCLECAVVLVKQRSPDTRMERGMVAETIEMCAKVVDVFAKHHDGDDEDADQFDKGYAVASRSVAAAIRALPQASVQTDPMVKQGLSDE